MKNNRFKNRMQGQSRHGFKGANFTQNINPSTNLDSNGPCGHVKGNAYQIMEKYLNAAKDAQANNDVVLAEICLQHADHYYRLYNIAIENENLRFHNHNADNITEENMPYDNAGENSTFEPDNVNSSLDDKTDNTSTMIDSGIAFLGTPIIPDDANKNIPDDLQEKPTKPKRQYRRRTPAKDTLVGIEVNSEAV